MSASDPMLAVELSGPDRVAVYTRSGARKEPFSPWFLVEAPDDCARSGLTGIRDIRPLQGGGSFHVWYPSSGWVPVHGQRL